jgi:molybdopterin biosynthesis enzyme
MIDDSSAQRIVRLTPLADVLAAIDAQVSAVKPFQCPSAQAFGHTLAATVVAPALPPQPIALRDGYAVEAAELVQASAYAPVPFPSIPPRIEVGEPLPRDADAVLPVETVMLRGNRAEAIAAVAPGDGVLAAAADATPERPLRQAGEFVRASDCAAFAAAGITEVTIRAPRISIGCGSAARSRVTDAAIDLLARLCGYAGAVLLDVCKEFSSLEQMLTDGETDAIIAVGGTGAGRHDAGVSTLRRYGRIDAHGIAISPGETAALGFAHDRPVLLAPGRLDAAMTIWLLIGRHLVAKLAGGKAVDAPSMLPLKRKVASSIGLTELVPVLCRDGMAEPLARGYLSLEALTRSDGYIVIPADSEGFAAGTLVAVGQWP